MPFSSKLIVTYLVCCAAITFLRIVPFIVLKKFAMPKWLMEFLQFVPIVIMTTLWFSCLFTAKQGQLPKVDWQYAGATVLALAAAVLTKDLLWIVIAGVASLALIRLF